MQREKGEKMTSVEPLPPFLPNGGKTGGKKMKDENFFTVKGWMVNRLKLKGNDLMVYAIIYGFSQNGEFHKISTRYISEAIGGVDAKTARAAIESLEKKGLIQKDQEDVAGVTVNSFRVAQDMVGEKFPGGREKFPGGGGENFPGGREKFPRGVGENFPPLYIYNNNNKNKEREYARAREGDGDDHTPPGFHQVAPAPVPDLGYPKTPQEVMDKATMAGIQGATIEEAEAFLDYYSSRGWLAAAGVRIINWQASFKSWLRKSKERRSKDEGRNQPERGIGQANRRRQSPADYGNTSLEEWEQIKRRYEETGKV